MTARMFSHKERLEMTRCKMAFRESMKHVREVPAAPGVKDYPEPVFDDYHCPLCGGELTRWEGCYRCKKCGWSKC